MEATKKVLVSYLTVFSCITLAYALAAWVYDFQPASYGCFGGPDVMQKYFFYPIQAHAPVVAFIAALLPAAVVITAVKRAFNADKSSI